MGGGGGADRPTSCEQGSNSFSMVDREFGGR